MKFKRKHLDLLEDTSDSIELDAFKEKIKKLYAEILERTYKIENPGASPEEIEAYVEENGIQFPDDGDNEEQEIDDLMGMLDEMIESEEDLESIQNDSKAPKYETSKLSANKDSSKVEETNYNPKHSATKTPNDLRSRMKVSTHYEPPKGKLFTSEIHERSRGTTKSIMNEAKIEKERLLRVVAKRNKQFGVRL